MIRIERKYLYKNENPSVIRIADHEIKEYKKIAKEIEKRSEDMSQHHLLRFYGRKNYPTVEEMEEHKVSYQLRKFLPTIIFYLQADVDDGTEMYQESKKYMKMITEKYVEIVKNKDFRPIEKLSQEEWKKSSAAELIPCFELLLEHYEESEFENFLLDLGWKKFMTLKNYKKTDYRQGYMQEETYNKLKEIWEIYFEENTPLPF